jgi:hypothetical protein
MTIEAPSVSSPADAVVPSRAPSRALELLIRVGGVLVAVVAAVLTGFLEIFMSTLRIGGVPIGVAVPAAVLANLAICWFAVATVGRRWALAPPWVAWTLVMFFAAGLRSNEGDYLISGNNWVAQVMILAGSLAFAGYTYRTILKGSPVTKK